MLTGKRIRELVKGMVASLPEIPQEILSNLPNANSRKLIERMLQHNPSGRPTMLDVVIFLKQNDVMKRESKSDFSKQPSKTTHNTSLEKELSERKGSSQGIFSSMFSKNKTMSFQEEEMQRMPSEKGFYSSPAFRRQQTSQFGVTPLIKPFCP